MSWDEFAQVNSLCGLKTMRPTKLITILDNRRRTNYSKLLFEVSIESTTKGTVYRWICQEPICH